MNNFHALFASIKSNFLQFLWKNLRQNTSILNEHNQGWAKYLSGSNVEIKKVLLRVIRQRTDQQFQSQICNQGGGNWTVAAQNLQKHA